ncbi:MAG: hypothetical protein WD532_07950 [Acidimicrobiia bacterium]
MTYDSNRNASTDRDVIVTSRAPNNNSGMAVAAVLVVIAILFAVWLFMNDGVDNTTSDTSPTETTQPVDTTLPTDTTAP